MEVVEDRYLESVRRIEEIRSQKSTYFTLVDTSEVAQQLMSKFRNMYISRIVNHSRGFLMRLMLERETVMMLVIIINIKRGSNPPTCPNRLFHKVTLDGS